MMRKLFPLATLIVFTLLMSCNNDDPAPGDEITIPDGYSLVWNDEFNGGSINTDNWQFELGDGSDYGLPPGWGNNELQLYTSDAENASIHQEGDVSSLRITAVKGSGESYTSAKLTTNELVSFRYGIIEIRAKMPQGQGLWPALWMLGDNRPLVDWPGCGEIDIAEMLGHQPNKYYATLHFTNAEKKHEEIQAEKEVSTDWFSTTYHVYSIDWSPESLDFYLDGTLLRSIPLEDDMKEFQRSMYLIFNVAVGGYWPGEPDGTTVFPQHMDIDYVRYFSKNDFTPDDPPVLNVDEETVGQIIEPNIGDNAIRDDFTDLGNLEVIAYGAGGEPVISTSETAIDGDLSLQYEFPGGNWGGAYFELAETRDLSGYTYLKFSLHKPATLVDAEIKLESPGTNMAVYLKDYTGTDVGSGFVEYTIPLADFTGLNLQELKIPFSMWNPVDGDANYTIGNVLIDNLYFAN
jgi:beta-glucanase (GH16 family)